MKGTLQLTHPGTSLNHNRLCELNKTIKLFRILRLSRVHVPASTWERNAVKCRKMLMTMLTTLHSQSSGEEFSWLWKACATPSTEILYVQTMADEWFQFYGISWFDVEHEGGRYPSFCFALSVLVAKRERLKQFPGFRAKTWAPLRSGLTLLSHRLQFCVTSFPGSSMLSIF